MSAKGITPGCGGDERCCDLLRQAAELIEACFTLGMSYQQHSRCLTHLLIMDITRTLICIYIHHNASLSPARRATNTELYVILTPP